MLIFRQVVRRPETAPALSFRLAAKKIQTIPARRKGRAKTPRPFLRCLVTQAMPFSAKSFFRYFRYPLFSGATSVPSFQQPPNPPLSVLL